MTLQTYFIKSKNQRENFKPKKALALWLQNIIELVYFV